MLAYWELGGSAGAYAAGSLLQARAASRMERRPRVDPGLLRRLAGQPTYLLGFAAQVVGFGMAFLARADLPVFLVLAGSSSAVALTAVAGVLLFGWRIRRTEILALVVMASGLALLAGAATPSPAPPMSPGSAALMVIVLLASIGLAFPAGRLTGAQSAVVLGILAGLAYGVVASVGRSLASSPLLVLPPNPHFWLMVAAAVVGQGLFAAGLQCDSATGTTAAMYATAMLMGTAVGLWLLSDQIAAGRGSWVAGGLALVVIGVWVLAAVVQPQTASRSDDDVPVIVSGRTT